ncbi:lipid A export permease/ATP-binding protein MsbA [Congregibacter brevis]|uniref:Lipid A export permease/ATP-binding protein MsbA n=1 Tax=Congregibacter brevis TaxID=3081201 RepID=A0ABZ0I8A6_9GAMM|nr:lipid A export permease/ATP-binding protein MsbA [Congregibacter sp. IMCC45268]
MPTQDNALQTSGGLQTYGRLLRYVRPHWPAFLVSMFGFVLYAATQSAFAGLMQYLPAAFDGSPLGNTGILSSSTLSNWEKRFGLNQAENVHLFLPLALVAIVSVRGIGSYLGSYYITYVARHVVNQLRLDVFAHINNLPAAYLAQRNSAELISLITFNIEQVAAAASTAIKVIVREGLTVIALLSYIFYLNWKLSLLFVVLAPIIGGIISLASSQFKKYSRRIQDSMGGITRVAAEAIRGFPVVRGYGGTASENARFEERSRYALSQDLKLARVNEISTPIIQWLTYTALAGLFWFGLDPALRGSMDSGQFLAYITAASLVAKPLRQLTQVNARIQRGIAAAESVFEVLDQSTESTSGRPLNEPSQGAYTLCDLHFRYPGTAEDTLHGISLDITSGETLALVGRSGSGKTTLVNLLAAQYPPPADSLFLDGVPMESLRLSELRRQIAFVSQHTTLFAASVRENIAYGDLEGASDEAITEALSQANALDFVSRLPAGLDTVLREEGDDFSGGQRQRLALARAFLKNAPILILDEATSAQDAESEGLIQQALQRILTGRTAIIIAHRLSTVEQVDRIAVMDQGSVVELGSHKELLAKQGLYAQLHQQQLQA